MEVTAAFAVIGAGPAGATLAALLAKKGNDVVLVDRDSFPRDKVCGEFLSYDAEPVLDVLGLAGMAGAVGAPSISRCRVHGVRRSFEFTFSRPARGISRRTLDHALVQQAERLGARVMLGTTVTKVERAGDHSTLICERDGETTRVIAQVVLGAWGRWGRLDRLLERPFVSDRTRRHFGFKRHYRMTREQSCIELYSFDRGYLGVAGVDGGVTNISGLVHDSRLASLKGGWPSFTQELGAESRPLRALFEAAAPAGEFLTSDPVIFGAKSAAAGELAFAGDAAAMIDPLTGNGMAMAMQSAVLLATHAAQIRSGERGGYAAEYQARFARRVRWSRRVAYLLSHPKLLDTAIAATPARAIAKKLMDRTRAAAGEAEELVHRFAAS